MSVICIKKLFESRGLPNPCKCPNCNEEKAEESREKEREA